MYQDINKIAEFLACRDVSELTKKALKETCGRERADAMFVFGNDLPYVMEFASGKFKNEIADKLIICGGIGHSTVRLMEAVRSSDKYAALREDIKDLSEAEIYAEIAEKIYKIPKDRIILDTLSTNCGENAANGYDLLERLKKEFHAILLIQDPILLKRSRASMERQRRGNEKIIAYAPFLPKVREDFSYDMEITPLWEFQRFIELLLGEISRLRDDENGYGPKGMNFIPHVEIPEDVLEAYERVREKYQKLNTREL